MERLLTEEDLDAIRELKDSRGWRLVEDRVEKELERNRAALEDPHSTSDYSVTRGQIKMARTVLRLPQIIEDQARADIKR